MSKETVLHKLLRSHSKIVSDQKWFKDCSKPGAGEVARVVLAWQEEIKHLPPASSCRLISESNIIFAQTKLAEFLGGEKDVPVFLKAHEKAKKLSLREKRFQDAFADTLEHFG